VSPRRIATVAALLVMASVVAWASIELGRPAELAPVLPIVIGERGPAPRPGGEGPGASNPDEEDQNPPPGEPGGSGGNPTGGAEPPPAPPPPPAGDDDDGDDDDGDDDDGGDDDGGDDADD
jgi:hypothetical protein